MAEQESEPDWYDSSPIALRPYCGECGTLLGFMFKQSPNMEVAGATALMSDFHNEPKRESC